MKGWPQSLGQFGGNEEVCGIDAAHLNSPMWPDLESLLPLNLSMQELRLTSLSNLDPSRRSQEREEC